MKREKSLVTVRSGPVITKKKTAYKQPTARTRIRYCIMWPCVLSTFRSFGASASILTCTPRPTHTHTTDTYSLSRSLPRLRGYIALEQAH